VNISRVLELYNFAVTWLLKKKIVKKRVNWQWFYVVLADLTYLFVFLFLSWFAISLSREKSWTGSCKDLKIKMKLLTYFIYFVGTLGKWREKEGFTYEISIISGSCQFGVV
jgi:hypothetical protein